MNAKSSMYSRVLGGAIALGLVTLVTYGVVQSQDENTSILSTGRLDLALFEISRKADVEILFSTTTGSTGPFIVQYRLYGDGRLVREILHNKSERTPFKIEEVYLLRDDIQLLFQLAVAADLPELTDERIQQRIGRPMLRMSDGSTVILELRFRTYQRPGESVGTAFSPRISMHAPGLQARFFPELAEAQALTTIRKALDDYFPRSASEMYWGRRE